MSSSQLSPGTSANDVQPDLFSVSAGHLSDFAERVSAFVAPVAADAGAVSRDPTALRLAEAVYAAFGDSRSPDGLTRAELAAACAAAVPSHVFDTRTRHASSP